MEPERRSPQPQPPIPAPQSREQSFFLNFSQDYTIVLLLRRALATLGCEHRYPASALGTKGLGVRTHRCVSMCSGTVRVIITVSLKLEVPESARNAGSRCPRLLRSPTSLPLSSSATSPRHIDVSTLPYIDQASHVFTSDTSPIRGGGGGTGQILPPASRCVSICVMCLNKPDGGGFYDFIAQGLHLGS